MSWHLLCVMFFLALALVLTHRPTYYERFREAFVREVNTFTDVVLDDKTVPTTPDDALQAAQIAVALTHSFRNSKPVFFGDDGEPILD